MDDELKAFLEAMRQENVAAHAETRAALEEAQRQNAAEFSSVRDEFSSVRDEFSSVRDEFAAVRAESRQEFAAVREENAAAHIETRRHFDVTAEGLRHEIRIVAEGVVTNTEKIGQLDAKFTRITSDLDTRVTRLEAASSSRR